jgi:predicted MPP superfamily phosphohydrolase
MRRIVLILAVLTALAAAVDGLFIEPFRIEVTHSAVGAQVAAPLKIAHLSDLHTTGFGRRERKLLELLDEEKPDVIIITGDTLGRGDHYEPVRFLLSKLHAPLGVWFVLGNWENERPVSNEHAFYAGAGIHLLVNEGAAIRPDIWLAGLDDPASSEPNFNTAVANAPPGAYVIAALHAPGYFDTIAGRAPLVLAGHAHGGQVRLPPIPVFWLPKECGRYLEGWYEERGSLMYVSRGIGTSILPIRFLCRPELAIITLQP